ncbi:MAG: hypothetical protein ABW005_09745 [Burkholderiaceae bacterium]
MTVVAVSLLWAACSVAETAGPLSAPLQAPIQIERGKGFALRVGESAQSADGALRIGFDGVSADSRCPTGEQCVWAGDASVRIWLQQGAGPRERREMRVAPGASPSSAALPGRDLELRLLRLEPYPVSGKAVDPAAYVLTLVLAPGSGSGAAADR